HPRIEVAVINDIADARTLAHLLKYDSVHGTLAEAVDYTEKGITINEKLYPLTHQPEIETISWASHAVDIVVECTGRYKTRPQLENHLKAGPKKVILSVPPQDDEISMVVLGVNDDSLTGDEMIISNASCTTNNAAPMLKVIQDALGIEQAYITTVHS